VLVQAPTSDQLSPIYSALSEAARTFPSISTPCFRHSARTSSWNDTLQ